MTLSLSIVAIILALFSVHGLAEPARKSCLRAALEELQSSVGSLPDFGPVERSALKNQRKERIATLIEKLETSNTPENHLELAEAAREIWEERGIPAKVQKKDTGYWIVIDTDRLPSSSVSSATKRTPWQLRAARSIKKEGYLVVLDTQRALEKRASLRPGEVFFLPWKDLDTAIASNGARHEMVHLKQHRRLLHDQGHFSMVSPATAMPKIRVFPSSTRKLLFNKTLYGKKSGHTLGEIQTYGFEVLSKLQTLRREIEALQKAGTAVPRKKLAKIQSDLEYLAKRAKSFSDFVESDLPIVAEAAVLKQPYVVRAVGSSGDLAILLGDGTRLQFHSAQVLDAVRSNLFSDLPDTLKPADPAAIRYFFGELEKDIEEQAKEVTEAITEATRMAQALKERGSTLR